MALAYFFTHIIKCVIFNRPCSLVLYNQRVVIVIILVTEIIPHDPKQVLILNFTTVCHCFRQTCSRGTEKGKEYCS